MSSVQFSNSSPIPTEKGKAGVPNKQDRKRKLSALEDHSSLPQDIINNTPTSLEKGEGILGNKKKICLSP